MRYIDSIDKNQSLSLKRFFTDNNNKFIFDMRLSQLTSEFYRD